MHGHSPGRRDDLHKIRSVTELHVVTLPAADPLCTDALESTEAIPCAGSSGVSAGTHGAGLPLPRFYFGFFFLNGVSKICTLK